jgi:copper chaperone CopZ
MHSQTLSMIELKVEGMSRLHWITAVTEALSPVPGAAKVHEVDLEQGRAGLG